MALPPHPPLSHREAAQAEVGHTDSTPALNGFLTGVFLLTITAVPLLQFTRELVAIGRGETPGRTLPQSLDVVAALQPRRAELATLVAPTAGFLAAARGVNDRVLRDLRTYETELTERDQLRRWLVPRVRRPLAAWLQGGNEETYIGREGWLFYRRDLDSVTGPGFLEPRVLARRARGGDPLESSPQPNPLPALTEFHEQLALRGITLVVLPVPVKPSIYPDQFSPQLGECHDPLQNPSFGPFLRQVAAAGIPHFDPAPLLLRARDSGPPLYLQTDTHWTPAAVTLVADALARFLRETVPLSPPAIQYSTHRIDVTNRGDLDRLLGLPPGAGGLTPETVPLPQVWAGDQPW
ncbi:MAG: alginate O-acetyltransferase AlgX-related protein, partial [Planctomycetaceae bacterium]